VKHILIFSCKVKCPSLNHPKGGKSKFKISKLDATTGLTKLSCNMLFGIKLIPLLEVISK
jgi:hypothetical protein